MSLPVPVTFAPSGAVAWVEPGTTVLDAAKAAGIVIPAQCASRGVCGSCAVRVLEGELEEPDQVEEQALLRGPSTVRLACRARVLGAVAVRPLLAATSAATSVERTNDELVVGVDLGTTTVGAVAAEAEGGRRVGSSVIVNRQQAWGADVLSRVSAALSGESQQLSDAARESVAEAVKGCLPPGVTPKTIVIAGNTAMSALLTGADVSSLAAHPFTPPVLPDITTLGAQLGSPGAAVSIVPALAGFVGGDCLAGLVHTGMLYAEQPSLLIDLGTNAEIALHSTRGLWVTSAAAGPAFEGVGVSCGVPAIAGAIASVDVEGDTFRLSTIHDAEPRGLSGAGVISLVAALLSVGHLASDGRLIADGPLHDLFTTDEAGVLRVRVASGVYFTQLDVRAIQMAKSAVRVGIEAVLRAGGVAPNELAEVLVAGAFGEALEVADLIAIGLLPASCAVSAKGVGNSSLAGAIAMALEPELLERASEQARGVIHVDLATGEGFTEALMNGLALQPFDLAKST